MSVGNVALSKVKKWLNGITAGTVAASKAVVVDANKDVTGGRNVTYTGTVTAAGFSGVLLNVPQSITLGTHDYGAAAVDWTLSAAELLKPMHKVTNASGAVNAIIPHTTIRPYFFINTSGQALTVKGATGTGIVIASTKSAWVMSDGTNVVRMTPDA